MRKYYQMEVMIKGVINVPVDEYDDKETAIECVEMSDDVTDVAYKIQENNDDPYFISVNKRTVKEIEY